MPRPGPILFQCDRLHSRLTTISCALRWAGANSKDGSTELKLSPCRGCSIGEQNAKDPSRAAVLPTQPMEIVMSAEKTCTKCKKTYTARGHAQKYCDDCGAKKPAGAKVDRAPRAARVSRGASKIGQAEALGRIAAAASRLAAPAQPRPSERLRDLRQLRERLASALAGVDTVLDFLSGGAS